MMAARRRGGGGGTTACLFLTGLVAWTTVSADDLPTDEFTPRSYDGVGNNEANPTWGAVGAIELRSVAQADYADDLFTPPGDLTRPTAREVMTDVFLASPPAVSTESVLFVAWGQLLTYDLSLTVDNSSEPFDIACNDGNGAEGIDIWCPLGASSDPISFFRSDAGLSDDDGANSVETRSPVNYATAFIDLDFVYGRSEEDAGTLRSSDGNGFMAVTEKGLPYLNGDGTWLIADQRTARFPVTFALHVVLLREHNRCCVEIAPGEGAETDEDIYQACRGWTIAVFQHITENDFLIRLLGGSVSDFVETSSSTSSASLSLSSSSASASAASGLASDGGGDTGSSGRRIRRKLTEEKEQDALEYPPERRRRGLWILSDYDEEENPGTDTFTLTAGAVAFESALPPNVRVVAEGYESTRYDNTELAAAVGADSLVSFFDGVEVADVLRGAVLSPVLAADSHFTTAVSNASPLFKLPVDAVQRGRDHGLPTYNDA
ncbi:unnamed protein product [Ectocarpus sp. 12 AP-2014]